MSVCAAGASVVSVNLLMSYLKTTGHRVGLLINFRAETIKKGLRRIVW